MSRSFERRLARYIKTARDDCDLCHVAYPHNSRLYIGITVDDRLATTCEACSGKLRKLYYMGLALDHGYGMLSPMPPDAPPRPQLSAEEVIRTVDAIQHAIGIIDADTERLQRRAGCTGMKRDLREHPWTTDDREWFKAHPDRTHRVRLPMDGEADKQVVTTPEGYVLVTLIRQVEPGARIRLGCHIRREIWQLMPRDSDPLLHAMFEIARGQVPMPSTGAAFMALVESYTPAGSA
jgi:hypothetical protein